MASSISTFYEDDFLPIILDHDGSPYPRDNTRDMESMSEPLKVPDHPIPQFQGCFAESMLESSRPDTTQAQNPSKNAVERRKLLLDQDSHEETYASRWKKKPGQQYHQLWKLMSQISFGVYLLLNGIAKDEEQVLNILQGHVDEVDQFLETTLDDFELAQKDIDERLKLLKVPLENSEVFDVMLEDRAFRLQIVNGNERIEHIITRTASAMNDALKDVEQGISATQQFIIYLTEEDDDLGWKEEQPDMVRVFDAMKGNANGWYRAFGSLQTKGGSLSASLVQLGTIVHEMSKRAGEVSRKQRFSTDHTSPLSATSMSSLRDTHRQNQYTNQNSSDSYKIIAPKIQETLPALRYAQRQEPTTEFKSHKERRAKPEPQIITLKPTTYSPSQSSAGTPGLKEESPEHEEPPTPQIGKRSSLRNRFSLKRKPSVDADRTDTSITSSKIVSTPPTSGQGSDSAYFSDNDKFYVSGGVPTPTYSEKPAFPVYHQPQAPYAVLTHRPSLPRLDSDSSYKSMGSPVSLRPVMANPNSPLQRPWTAAPGDTRAPPSRMGMSTMSKMTSMSTLTLNETEKKPKKKKSALNWFRKAFSLSEEEKAAFEARRRAPPPRPEEEVRPLFLDGKRIRDGHVVIRNGRVVHYREDVRPDSRMQSRDGASTRASTRQQQR